MNSTALRSQLDSFRLRFARTARAWRGCFALLAYAQGGHAISNQDVERLWVEI